MTTPSSGQIAVSQVTAEIGLSNSSVQFNTLHGYVLPAQRQSYEQMTEWYNKAYFRLSTGGNCNNGNCVTFNCGYFGGINCFNCYNCANINCGSLASQSWLQTNCNCACTYNCSQYQYSYNCNCNC
jgi:hypothetical protein